MVPPANANLDSGTLDSSERSIGSANAAPYVGHTLSDRYRLLRLLGRGGMGSVYLGRHLIVGKPVAVKVLDATCAQDDHGFKRLFREAQAAASIGHPNIIDVQDVGMTPSGDPFLVMEYLEGEDLSGLMLRKKTLSLAEVCGVMEPVLSALAAAHAKGIVHRDLKPANIYLVGRSQATPMVKLIDFGVSKFVGATDQAKLTLPGAVLGTPAYMSPEQARGQSEVDERADLYAVGVMLFQMLTGKLPFEGSNYNDLIFKIVYDEPSLFDTKLEELPAEIRMIIAKAMRKDPNERYQSSAELLEAFRTLQAWSERTDGLARLAECIDVQAFGGGDLGMMTQKSGGSHIDVHELVRQDAERVEMAETRLEPAVAGRLMPEVKPDDDVPAAHTTERERTVGLAWPVAAVAGSVTIAVVALWLTSSGQENRGAATTPSASVASAPAPSSVQVKVEGAPDGATIYFDGAPVSLNPFRVRAGDTIVPIRVESPGYEPFLKTVVPSKDVTVRVELVPVASVQRPGGEPSAPPPSTTKPPAPSATKEPGNIGKTGRDTYYTDRFE